MTRFQDDLHSRIAEHLHTMDTNTTPETPTADAPRFDHVDFIIRFEGGEVTPRELVEGFAQLIRSGIVWSLQGFYGRTARNIIEGGLVSPEGEVDWDRFDELVDAGELED